MRARILAAVGGVVAAATLTTGLVLAPAATADPPITIGLLDPTCLVSVVLNGQLICLVYIPTSTPTPTTAPSPTTVHSF